MTSVIDFNGINIAALHSARSLLPSLIPGGKFRSLEYVVKNPCRNDQQLGSFSINYKTGVWKDFASNDGGGDIVSFYAYCRNCSQGDAARELADRLGVPLVQVHKLNGHNKPSRFVSAVRAPPATPSAIDATKPTARVYAWTDAGPPARNDEMRRHVYSSGDFPMRVKIKHADGRYSNWYRSFRDGVPIGWQPKKPGDYRAIPYRTAAMDPFDSDLIGGEILWPEGERDVDSLSSINLPAFTFGGVGDGVPDEIGKFLKDRRLVILADNDEPGRAHAEKKAAIAHAAGAAAIKILHFDELPPKGDVSDFIASGGTIEQLYERADAAPLWAPPVPAQAETITRAERQLVIQCADEIEPRSVTWLWRGRLALGKQTCIAGEPGTGKSQLLIAIIAAVTTGGEWPCGEGRAPLGHAIILSAEDGAADTIIPRLLAAGADRSRVHIVSAVHNSDGSRRALNLQHDIDLLEKEIARIGQVLLVGIDPVSSYLGKTDSHKNSEVRGVLEPLSEMAERTRVAILSVTHFSKAGAGGTTKALHRFIGSIAFTGAPRAAFAVIEDAEHEGRRLFLHVKNNLAQKPQGLAFRLEQSLVGNDILVSHIVWDSEPAAITSDEALAADSAGGETRTAKADCIEFLQALLADGWIEVADITAEAVGAGLHADGKQLKDNKPMRHARAALKVETHRDGFGKGARHFWALPGTPWAPSNSMGAQSTERAPMSDEGRP